MAKLCSRIDSRQQSSERSDDMDAKKQSYSNEAAVTDDGGDSNALEVVRITKTGKVIRI